MPGRRQTLQRGVIILPSAFTLGNLFFGIYAMISVSRGDFLWAGWCIIIAGILDMLDGSVARLTRTGSAFGAELDSLVDAVSFGVAPGFIMFALFFADTQWSWVLSFVYVTAVVVRLARYNIEQGGEAKRYFHGLPSPSAGMALASYYPFSQTSFFATYLGDLPWQQIMGVGMVLLSVLMVSHVPYGKVGKIGLRSARGLVNTVIAVAAIFLAVSVPEFYFFTVLVLYIVWGLVKSVLLGFLDRIPSGDPLLDEEEGEVGARTEVRDMDYGDLVPNGAAHLKIDSQSAPDRGMEEEA
ncbi:MAG: CDP-diacylglycerol--serine O-phosphatidyltransferase [Longimicrobiales bacterium]|jgi:CDP-diacylglycerol--serine O-phosphatidyltransferase|nr:CDP-diacylglycerol--serine O-phosphatidyltransferase [Longimicrobiales bacterium]